MAYINIYNNFPGIVGLLKYRPETANPLNDLAEILLRGSSSLSSGERESYLTYKNKYHFCHNSH